MEKILAKLPNLTYCENFDLWGIVQPFNVFSNITFFAVAMLIIARMARFHVLTASTATLALLIWAVGICSTIWHINLVKFWLFFDILSIVVFIFAFQLILLNKIWQINFVYSFLFACGFVAISWLCKDWLDHFVPLASAGFLPLIVFLAGVAVFTRIKDYYYALLVFVLAFIFRIIDISTCEYTYIGTHFLWHIFAAMTIYFAMRALISQIDQKNAV